MYRDISGNGTAYAMCVLPAAYLFKNITANGTTSVKGSPGVLKGIIVNSLGTVASLTTIYDSTSASGTKVGSLNTLSILGPIDYDVWMTTGITITTTGVLPPDITVIYL